MASWHCGGPGSTCQHSTLVQVSDGDAMSGTIAATNCGDGACTWVITTKDKTSGGNTTLSVNATQGYIQGIGGAVEVYNLVSCRQYPANGVTFSSETFDDTFGSVTPRFTNIVFGGNPSCNYNVTSTSTSTSLFHNPQPVIAQGGLSASIGSCILSCSTTPAIGSISASSGTMTLIDDYSDKGTMNLTGFTASGSFTAGTGSCIFDCGFTAIGAISGSGSTITLEDSFGDKGTITLTGATASGSFTASGNGCLSACTSVAIASIHAHGGTVITVTDTYGHTGKITLAKK
jgi:hypothetical protein